MIIYIIKSSLCLSIVLGLYTVLLEREKMHRFNRFYLLFGLIFSFIVPLLTIGVAEKVFAENILLTEGAMQLMVSEENAGPINYAESLFTTKMILSFIYLLVAVILLLRFSINIGHLFRKIIRYKKILYKNILLVLIKEKMLPHTFLHFVFVNKEEYDRNEIEHELFTHEITHARQRHSLDILFIEILQILFWFNPILIFYKRKIQLNHEFLADDRVVKKHEKISFYQNLLIQKVHNKASDSLASNFNYSITKKRLTMMTKNTSRSKAILYGSITFPLFILLLLVFGKKVTAQNPSSFDQKIHYVDKNAKYFKNATFVFKNKNGAPIIKSYNELTENEKSAIPPLPPPPPGVNKEGHSNPSALPSGTRVYNDPERNNYKIILPKSHESKEISTSSSHVLNPRPSIISNSAIDTVIPPPPPAVPRPPKPPTPVVAVSPQTVPATPAPPTSPTPGSSPAPTSLPAPPAPPSPLAAPTPPSPSAAPSPIVAPSPPAPPPPPPSPLELAKKLAKEGAIFTLDGDKISSEKALKILEDLDQVQSFHISRENGKKPMVALKLN